MDWITGQLQARDKLDASWWFAWPCDAYTQVWLPWLWQHQETHQVEIAFERLSPDFRKWLAERDAELDEPTDPVGSAR